MFELAPVPFEEAIAAAVARRLELPDVYYGELVGRARAVAFSVAGLSRIEQVRYVLATLVRSMEDGQSFDDWRKAAVRDPTVRRFPRYRHETIFRTNIQGHYAAGRCVHIRRHADRRPYLLYSAINDSRVRPTHWKMNGTLLSAKDAWWRDHMPPNGYNCRCSVVSLTEKQAQRRGGKTRRPTGTGTAPDEGWDYSPCDAEHGYTESVRRARRLPVAGRTTVLDDTLKAAAKRAGTRSYQRTKPFPEADMVKVSASITQVLNFMRR